MTHYLTHYPDEPTVLFFTRVHNDGTKENGFALKEGRFRLEVREKFFTQRAEWPW